MIRFRSKNVRDEAATGGTVAMSFGYVLCFVSFATMYVMGEYPGWWVRFMVVTGLVGAAGNLFWLMNRDGQ